MRKDAESCKKMRKVAKSCGIVKLAKVVISATSATARNSRGCDKWQREEVMCGCCETEDGRQQTLTFAAEVDAEDVGQLVDENQRHLDGAHHRLDVVRRHHRSDVTAG